MANITQSTPTTINVWSTEEKIFQSFFYETNGDGTGIGYIRFLLLFASHPNELPATQRYTLERIQFLTSDLQLDAGGVNFKTPCVRLIPDYFPMLYLPRSIYLPIKVSQSRNNYLYSHDEELPLPYYLGSPNINSTPAIEVHWTDNTGVEIYETVITLSYPVFDKDLKPISNKEIRF